MAWRILNPFIRSGEVLRVIGVVSTYNFSVRPSVLMGIEDNFLAYCFDEACAFIIRQIQDGKEPIMRVEQDNVVYKKPSDLYKRFKRNE